MVETNESCDNWGDDSPWMRNIEPHIAFEDLHKQVQERRQRFKAKQQEQIKKVFPPGLLESGNERNIKAFCAEHNIHFLIVPGSMFDVFYYPSYLAKQYD